MNCAGKIKASLAALPGVESVDVDTRQAIVRGNTELKPLINAITELGYEAGYRHTLLLAGLSCGNCVKKVESALAAHPQVADFTVSKTQASVTGTITREELVAIIEQLGFSARGQAANEEQAEQAASTDAQTDTADFAEEHTDAKSSSGSGEAIQLLLSGMTCASCVASVEKAILSVPGITSANVNLAERTALVYGTAATEKIIAAISDAGYGAEQSEDEQSRRARQQQQSQQAFRQHLRNASIALSVGIPMMAWGLFGGSMMINSTTSQIGWGLAGLVTFALLFTIGRHFFINSWNAFRHHRATMDTLVALGTGSAWLYSMLVVLMPEMFPEQARHVYFEASVMILGLITLGHALEARARSQTSKALEQLIDLQPQTAIIVSNGTERKAPLAEVKTGMLLRLRPGAKVPVDGTIEDGQSYLDESMLTGEPIPAHKQPGDKVHAGTINQNGSLLFRAEQIGNDTMLARIINLVRQAQNSKPALARLADTISAIFVPAVVIIAIVTAMAWYYLGPEPSSIYMLVTATHCTDHCLPVRLGAGNPDVGHRRYRPGRGIRRADPRCRGHAACCRDRHRGAGQNRHPDRRQAPGHRPAKLQ